MRTKLAQPFVQAGVAIIPIALAVCALTVPGHGQTGEQGNPQQQQSVNDRIDAFVATYAEAVAAGDVDAINACVNIDAMIDTAIAGLPLQPAERAGIARGIKQGFDWGATLTSSVGEGGHYRFLHMHNVDGRAHALFRLVNNDSGLNYHDLKLGFDSSGEIVIEDCKVYLSSEYLSETFHRALEVGLRSDRPAAFKGKDDGTGAYFREYIEFLGRFERGDFVGALEYYKTMPEQAQGDKSILILRTQAAAAVSIEDTIEVGEDFVRRYPDDPASALYKIDPYILTGRFDDAIGAVEDVRRLVGDDPYLDSLIADIHLLQERWADAARFAKVALEKDPTLEAAWWTALTVSLAQARHTQTREILNVLARRFGYVFEHLDQYPDYADFAQSAEYSGFLSDMEHLAAARPDGLPE